MGCDVALTFRCPICVSDDISVIDITIDGITAQYYHCNECEFEWPVPVSATSSDETEAEE